MYRTTGSYCAQASETPMRSQRGTKNSSSARPVTSFTAHAGETGTNCILCKNEKHPLYICVRFKAFAHDKMVSTLKDNKICMNCLKPGHFVKQCKSMHRCRKCQKPHHTLLHIEPEQSTQVTPMSSSYVNQSCCQASDIPCCDRFGIERSVDDLLHTC